MPEHIVVRPTGDRARAADLALVLIVPSVSVRIVLSALTLCVLELLFRFGHPGAFHNTSTVNGSPFIAEFGVAETGQTTPASFPPRKGVAAHS